jgi:hypothetical protein
MTVLSEPGFYEIDPADYRSDPAPETSLNQSRGKILLEQCPRAAWWSHPRLNPQYVQHRRGEAKFDLGIVAHTLFLGEGQEFQIVDAPDYRKGPAQIARDTYRDAGFIPILKHQHATAKSMVTEAHRQLTDIDGGAEAFNPAFGKMELCALAKDPVGCWTRTLIDFYGSNVSTGVTCWDYKTTTGSANPQMIAGTFNRLGWAFQAAFQERIICLLKPHLAGKVRFRFLVQEADEPYLVSVVEPSGQAMTLAHKMVAAAIAIWHRCVKTNQWPGYPRRPVSVGAWANIEQAWLTRELEDDLVGLAANDPFLNTHPGYITPPPFDYDSFRPEPEDKEGEPIAELAKRKRGRPPLTPETIAARRAHQWKAKDKP